MISIRRRSIPLPFLLIGFVAAFGFIGAIVAGAGRPQQPQASQEAK